jgi:hypothetical protein
MKTMTLSVAMRRFAAIAVTVAFAHIARGPAVDSATVTDQMTGKHAGAPAVVLAQGRCFNGKCY